MIKKIHFLLFLFLLSLFSFSQSNSLSENAIVSIITCGTGNESYSLYGHTAIRIKDSTRGIDIVYNYGAFDFQTQNFILKFVKGDLQYFVTANNYSDFEASYIYDNRSIYEQELNLDLSKKQQLYQELNKSLFSEDRFYTYKFIDKNCTTMVIDKINAIVGSKIIATKKPITRTYRDILFPYVENHYFQKLGINIIFGKKVDNDAETLFLPLELFEVLKETQYKEEALVSKTNIVFEAKKIIPKISLLNSAFSIIGLLLFIILVDKKSINIIYLTLTGLLGVFLLLVGLYSNHEEVLWNYNILVFNPLLLLFIYAFYRKNPKFIINVGKLNLACLIIYLLLLLNKIDLYLLLPFIIANFYLISRVIKKCRYKYGETDTIVL